MAFESPAGAPERLLPGEIEERLKSAFNRCAGVVLAAVALCSCLALVSWSVEDAKILRSGVGSTGNLMGPAGAVAGDILFNGLGIAGVFLLVPPALWGVQIALAERLERWRTKIFLWIVASGCLAGALAAVPIIPAWPIRHGFGGLGGDFVYALTSGLLASFNPAHAGLAAGLLLFAVGASSLLGAVGAGRDDLGRLWHGNRSTHLRQHVWRGLEPDGPMPVLAGGPALPPEASPEPMQPIAAAPRIERPAGPGPMARLGAALSALSAALPRRSAPVDHGLADRAYAEPQLAGMPSPGLAPAGAPTPQGMPPRGPVPPVAAPARGPMQPAAGGPGRGAAAQQQPGPQARPESAYRRPSLNILKRGPAAKPGPETSQGVLRGISKLLEDVLSDFGVKGQIQAVKPGPVITLYELEPARGVKASRVIGLSDDIARSMSAISARVSIVPGRSVIGIELPNARRDTVWLRDLLESEAYRSAGGALPLVLGRSISGEPVIADLARMPHVLVAGTTGSGKSVGINAMILSLLYRLGPQDCRFLMIDPKMLELSVYNGIPHLLAPVITDPQRAVSALNWVVGEMEERYKRMSQLSVRSIEAFNNRVRHARARGEAMVRTVQTGFDQHTGQPVYEQQRLAPEPMPYIVVIVDEMADLMLTAGKEIEGAVQRLAQMARAAGIHLIMATQRPSVDVVTGTIKANFPTRISFKVASKIDSRTILGEQGAEQLLGAGDMLLSSGNGQTVRVHGPFVADEEVEQVTRYLRSLGAPAYVAGIDELPADDADEGGETEMGEAASDDLYDKAVALVLRDGKASTSYVQRRLSIGYNRAADLIERMERDGLISAANSVGKREILMGGSGGRR